MEEHYIMSVPKENSNPLQAYSGIYKNPSIQVINIGR
jgi:hypothetical protein